MLETRLRVVALLVPDQHDLAPAQRRESTQDRGIFAEIAIPAQRHEIGKGVLYVVAEMRTLRMPGNLRLLPRRERGVDFLELVGALGLQLGELVAHVDLLALVGGAQFGNPSLELGNRLLEVEKSQHPGLLSAPCGMCKPPRCARGCLSFTSATSFAASTCV